MRTRGKSSEFQLLSGLFFRLLPYQVLLIVISAVNGIVDSLKPSLTWERRHISILLLYIMRLYLLRKEFLLRSRRDMAVRYLNPDFSCLPKTVRMLS